MTFKNRFIQLTLLFILTVTFQVQAATNSCGPSNWTATSDKTISCVHGSGNPDIDMVTEALVAMQLQGADTAEVDKVTVYEANATEGSTNLFNVELQAGFDWGEIPNGGTWTINKLFWNQYENAVISFKGGREHAIFIVEKGSNLVDLTGNWSLDGTKNGLSNIKLWGVNKIPEPSVIALFGIGFAGLAFSRRKRKNK